MVAHSTEPASGDAVAIVTGGSWGSGRALASQLASRGYAVVVVYLRDQGGAEAVVDAIVRAKGTALAVRADLTDELDVERLFDETAVAFGGVDVVVHAARRGTAVVCRHAARRLRPGGAIVGVSGGRAVTPVLAGELQARGISLERSAFAFLDRWRQPPGD
jgi:3-oxoacyl-[acyl-carrier protein] reductase